MRTYPVRNNDEIDIDSMLIPLSFIIVHSIIMIHYNEWKSIDHVAIDHVPTTSLLTTSCK